MAADPVIYCLEQVTDYYAFERLCHDLMVAVGYTRIEPLGGSADKGRDAIHTSADSAAVTIFAYSVREDWYAKLLEDAKKIRRHRHPCDRLVFITTASPSSDERDRATNAIRSTSGWLLEMYGIERLRALLATTCSGLIPKHPQIFNPAFFPVAVQKRVQLDGELRNALGVLLSALDEYLDANSTGSGLLGTYPPIVSGHPVHAAVVSLEHHYPKHMLSPDGRSLWIRLLQASRRNEPESYEPGYAASDFRKWVDDLLQGRGAA